MNLPLSLYSPVLSGGCLGQYNRMAKKKKMIPDAKIVLSTFVLNCNKKNYVVNNCIAAVVFFFTKVDILHRQIKY